VFTGEFEHTLDEKGRVVLPSRFRPHLERLVVTKGRDGCLSVFPPPVFETIAAELGKAGARARDMRRFFIGGASEQQTDKQGRIQIPETLRRYAGLERDVMVIGLEDRIEIWDRAKYTAKQGEIEQRFRESADADADLPI
jgi:MraZ protein